jgi:hypothetical protein
MKTNYEYEKIFHSFTKHRLSSYNNIITYDNQIFKFKDRIHEFNKTMRDMIIKPSKKELEPVKIFVKENNEKKIYTDKSNSENNSTESKEDENSIKKVNTKKVQIKHRILIIFYIH